ncbi:MAG: YncE family protein [Thermoplasmata archaeon]|nr:YncE family protein [Thermoplasmata archaeon]
MGAHANLNQTSFLRRLVVAAVFCGLVGMASFGLGSTHPSLRSAGAISLDRGLAVRGLAATVGVGSQPVGVAYDSGKGEVFVTNSGSGNVSVISDATDSVVATISVGSKPYAAAYDSGKGEVFIANEQGGSVSVVNDTNNSVVATVSTGNYPIGLAYDSGKGEIFVAGDQTSVFVISDSTNAVVATVGVGNVTQAVTYDATHGQVFTSMFDDQDLWGISDATNAVTSIVHVGTTPIGLATDSAKGLVFTANSGSANSTAVSTASRTVVANVHVGSSPSAVAYDPSQGEVLIANSGSANVSVISDATDKVVSTFPVGNAPYGIAFDTGKGVAFVTSYGSNDVTVAAPGGGTGGPTHYAITCTESNLPTSTSWSVTLNGTTLSSTTSTIVFSEPNGSFPYTVGAVAGYSASPASGTAQVTGAAVALPIAFTVTNSGPYSVTFTESGLSAGTSWTVTLNSVPLSSTTTTAVFSEPNGVYPFTVAAAGTDTPTPASGSVTVAGAAVGQTITFSGPGAPTYDVTFTETGLPAGSTWQVTLNGQTQSTSTTGTTFTVPNGTYTYQTLALIAYAPVPANGSLVVSGVAVTTPIVYYEVYPLALTQAGLPAGTNWSATVTKTGSGVVLIVGLGNPAVTRWSNGASTIHFSVSNGTYDYSTSVSGFSAPGGTITVNGASPSTTTVNFAATSSASSSAGSVALYEAVVIAVAVIVVVVVVALVAMRRRGRNAPPATP